MARVRCPEQLFKRAFRAMEQGRITPTELHEVLDPILDSLPEHLLLKYLAFIRQV